MGAGCACAGAGSGGVGSPSPLSPASAIEGQAAGVEWSYALLDLNDGGSGGANGAGAGSAILLLQIKFLVSYRPLQDSRLTATRGWPGAFKIGSVPIR